MSANAHSGAADHGAHGHHDHDHHASGEAHGSFKGYMTGFILSVILTAIPFYLVMTGALGDARLTGIVIMAFAAVQIVVHMIYFLHMNFRSEGGWSMLALVFTIIIVGIMIVGSLWVMYHMNANMMPLHDMRNMP